MQTRCPACQTLYRIDDDVLMRAGGQARCFRCNNIFDAYANPADPDQETSDQALDLVPEPAVETDSQSLDLEDLSSLADLPEVPDADAFSSSGLSEELQQPVQTGLDGEPPDPDQDAGPADSPDTGQIDLHSALSLELPEDLPELEPADTAQPSTEQALTPAPKPGLLHTLLPRLAAALLVLTAMGQLTWQLRDQVLATPAGHGLAENLCDLAGCILPPRRAPSRFEVMERNIAPAPGQSGVLVMHLSFRNGAEFAQPLPDIQLSLYDGEEKLMARRRLHPDEYLFPAPAGDTLVESGAELSLDLQLEDPGRKATGFKLEFL